MINKINTYIKEYYGTICVVIVVVSQLITWNYLSRLERDININRNFIKQVSLDLRHY